VSVGKIKAIFLLVSPVVQDREPKTDLALGNRRCLDTNMRALIENGSPRPVLYKEHSGQSRRTRNTEYNIFRKLELRIERFRLNPFRLIIEIVSKFFV